VILENIGNNAADTNGFHLYSIVEKAITVTQADTKPYTIYGSIYVYGDSEDAVTLSNLKVETLKVPHTGDSALKPFVATIGGITDNLTVTNCNVKVSSTAHSSVGPSETASPLYTGIRIYPLTSGFSYNFSGNTITGLKAPTYFTTGLSIGLAVYDANNWDHRYPAIKENTTTYNKEALKLLDLTGHDLYTNFFSTIESWGNTITNFDNEAVFRNDYKGTGNFVKVYYSNPASYSYEGLRDAVNWMNDVTNTDFTIEVYLATNASVMGDIGINVLTTLIIKDGVTLDITGNLTAGTGAKIQLGAGSSITVTGTGSPGISGAGTYTYTDSTWVMSNG
jgi:hypothetical protein